jgi:putative transposase
MSCSGVPKSMHLKVIMILKVIHTMNSHETPESKALAVADELKLKELAETAKVVRECYAETLMCTAPSEHWRRILTNNAINHLNR